MTYRCWYCRKQIHPWEAVRVVISDGTTRIVCKDDRHCKPSGIQCYGRKPRKKKQPRNKRLDSYRKKHHGKEMPP